MWDIDFSDLRVMMVNSFSGLRIGISTDIYPRLEILAQCGILVSELSFSTFFYAFLNMLFCYITIIFNLMSELVILLVITINDDLTIIKILIFSSCHCVL